MANTKISALTANTNPNGNEELVYAYNNANGKMTLDTMKTFASADSQATLVSGVNIKTINNTSILGSGNIDVSGGGGGGFTPTELGGDANIWELSEGAYITEYDLYYISGSKVPASSSGTGRARRQMLFVTVDDNGTRGYFVFNAGGLTSNSISRASFGYSISSSSGICNQLGARDYVLDNTFIGTTSIDSVQGDELTQIISNLAGDGATQDLRISAETPPYPGITYTICITSVASAYSITLGTGVTNPLGITLPTNSNKGCVITVLTTSTTTGIVTSCQMMQ